MVANVVLDLPQLYTKPSGNDLLQALHSLKLQPSAFSRQNEGASCLPLGNVTRYLTSIVASPLSWISDEGLQEIIWGEASARLSERSGRTGMSSVSRTFSIPTYGGEIEIILHEPALTADNLGLKTWAASFLLAKRLVNFDIPTSNPPQQLRILELGSGTGLVGIAAAAVLGAHVHLTDLPEIVLNLAANVESNRLMITEHGGRATSGELDWSLQHNHGTLPDEQRYPLIFAADPLYSPEHPKWLVQTVEGWLQRNASARLILELPIRDAYVAEREDFARRIHETGLVSVENGTEVGFDDWHGKDGSLVEVTCSWTVYKWSDSILRPIDPS